MNESSFHFTWRSHTGWGHSFSRGFFYWIAFVQRHACPGHAMHDPHPLLAGGITPRLFLTATPPPPTKES